MDNILVTWLHDGPLQNNSSKIPNLTVPMILVFAYMLISS